jgi:hypothetical protein
MLEDAVEDLLKRQGLVKHEGRIKAAFLKGISNFGDETLGPRWFMRNVKRFENLYRARFFADFVIYDVERYPNGLVIEVKAQETPGSVDEKYVFTVLSLKQLYDEQKVSTWLVFSGGGVRACAVDWMRSEEVWTAKKRQFRFMTESDLRRTLLNELRAKKSR